MSDVYQTITDKIVRMIEAVAGEWRMPWHGEGLKAPRNPLSGTKYRGINVPLLWAGAEECGYSSSLWATYKQWSAAGAQVRKGERSQLCFSWKRLENASDDGDEGEQDGKSKIRFVARAYNVFAAEQVDGFELKASDPTVGLTDDQRIAAADAFFNGLGSIVRHGGNCPASAPMRQIG